jgi:hypothetical protein
LLRERLGLLDVPALAVPVASAQEHDDHTTAAREIDAIAGSGVDAQLADVLTE